MKKVLIAIGIVAISFIVGCSALKANADEKSIFTYLGHTSEYGSYLYKYEDKETNKIIYVIESPNVSGGRAISVVNK